MELSKTANSEKLKIILLTTFYPPVVGGVETQVEDLALQLIKNKYDVEVLTTNSARGNRKLDLPTGVQEEYNGVKVTHLNTLFSVSQYHKITLGFISELIKKEYDIIHVHGLRKFELYTAIVIGRLRSKKVIVSTHNPFTTVNRSLLLKVTFSIYDFLVGWLMIFINKVIVLSNSEIEKMKRFWVNESKIVRIPNAISDDFYLKPTEDEIKEAIKLTNLSEKLEKYPRIVLGVGRIHKNKGYQQLERAILENPDTLFLIVGGDDGYLTYLKNLYQGLDNVHLTERFYSRSILISLYSLADIFIMPSLHEPFGIVLLEAMAAGCVPIATENGGPRQILTNNFDDPEIKAEINSTFTTKNGFLVNPSDQAAISKLIKELVNDEDKLTKISKSAKVHAKKYHWKKIFPKYENVYKDL